MPLRVVSSSLAGRLYTNGLLDGVRISGNNRIGLDHSIMGIFCLSRSLFVHRHPRIERLCLVQANEVTLLAPKSVKTGLGSILTGSLGVDQDSVPNRSQRCLVE